MQQETLTKEALTSLLIEAEKAHAEYEYALGHRDPDWATWYFRNSCVVIAWLTRWRLSAVWILCVRGSGSVMRIISLISRMINKMITYAVLFHDPCQVHFSLYKSHLSAMGFESREH